MSLSRTVSEMAISVESRNPPPRVFNALLKGFPLELGTDARDQKTRMMGYRAEKEVWRYLQPCGYNAPKWRTEYGQTESGVGRQQRPRLRRASRGKSCIHAPLTNDDLRRASWVGEPNVCLWGVQTTETKIDCLSANHLFLYRHNMCGYLCYCVHAQYLVRS